MNTKLRCHPIWVRPCLVAVFTVLSPYRAAGEALLPGITHVQSLDGIEEYRLDSNGLQVLLKTDHSAPVVTFNVTYRVGSRNEGAGTTGATHLLEHLMFKGSDHFSEATGNSVKQYLGASGADYNATTSLDRTNYFATLGARDLEGYMAIEADRMRHLLLRESDRQSEMTVVRNEYELGENDPTVALSKEVIAAMFLAHPYHHSAIGWRSDIEHVPLEKLKDFYDTFYWPNNATVTIVGDIESASALALVERYYGAIPRSTRPIPQVYTVEPPQSGARRLLLKRVAELGVVMMAYKVPSALHADIPALDVLAGILAQGQSSRFHTILVDSNLARAVEALVYRQRDPGMLVITLALAPQATHAEVEQLASAEIERIKRDGVSAEDVRRMIRHSLRQMVFARDGTAGAAAALNEWIARGDWTQYVHYAERLAQVTPGAVQRVARTYFTEDQCTTGWFVPQTPPGSSVAVHPARGGTP